MFTLWALKRFQQGLGGKYCPPRLWKNNLLDQGQEHVVEVFKDQLLEPRFLQHWNGGFQQGSRNHNRYIRFRRVQKIFDEPERQSYDKKTSCDQ